MKIMDGLWIGALMNAVFLLPWVLVLFFLEYYNIRLYQITRREDCQRLQKFIASWCTHHIGEKKGCGYSFGKWYLLYLSVPHGYDASNGWLLATRSSYEKIFLTENNEIEIVQDDQSIETKCAAEEDENDKIVIYDRMGSFDGCWFKDRKVSMARMKPTSIQQDALDKIIEHQTRYKHTVAFLHGPPNTGKSVMGLLLAQHYKGGYCSTLKPWQPGDLIGELMAEMEENDGQTMVIVFDEVDIAMRQIHVGIPSHKKIPIAVANKHGWNKMLDEIHWGMYPNLILLLITNNTPDVFHNLDPSYLRTGRVDLIFSFTTPLKTP
jgi:hypothetical protein